MKKVLLVTLQCANIGCRLQNYALQKVLIDMGCEVWTPYYCLELNTLIKRVKNCIKILLGAIGIKKYRPCIYHTRRLKRYMEFDKQYIHNRFKLTYVDAFKKNWDEFDYAITGSDQVWHKWSSEEKELEYFYLEFVDENKRIAYAPSFGFDSFPERDVQLHIDGICGMHRLSCREEKGQKLIKELTGRDAKILLDPTLLLDKEHWSQMGKKPDRFDISKPYVLVYFLGEKIDNYRVSINKLVNERNLKIIDVYDVFSLKSQLTTPDEFIWLIEHASYVCTDSFHAVVFSIIFEKKFLAYRRCEIGADKMFDRIENILKIYNLSTRIYEDDIDKIYIDYTLEEIGFLKEASLEYLNECLSQSNI